jgi:hypothetical protein
MDGVVAAAMGCGGVTEVKDSGWDIGDEAVGEVWERTQIARKEGN